MQYNHIYLLIDIPISIIFKIITLTKFSEGEKFSTDPI